MSAIAQMSATFFVADLGLVIWAWLSGYDETRAGFKTVRFWRQTVMAVLSPPVRYEEVNGPLALTDLALLRSGESAPNRKAIQASEPASL